MKLSEELRTEYKKEIIEVLRVLAIIADLEKGDSAEIRFSLDNKNIKADITFEVIDYE